jgi:hypothetical protein
VSDAAIVEGEAEPTFWRKLQGSGKGEKKVVGGSGLQISLYRITL